jgi:hypothetical protein
MTDIDDEFMECKECSKKPGTPILCKSCQHNRVLIEILQEKVNHMSIDNHPNFHASNFAVHITAAFYESLRGGATAKNTPDISNEVIEFICKIEDMVDRAVESADARPLKGYAERREIHDKDVK